MSNTRLTGVAAWEQNQAEKERKERISKLANTINPDFLTYQKNTEKDAKQAQNEGLARNKDFFNRRELEKLSPETAKQLQNFELEKAQSTAKAKWDANAKKLQQSFQLKEESKKIPTNFFLDPDTYKRVPFGKAGQALLMRGALRAQSDIDVGRAQRRSLSAQAQQNLAQASRTQQLTPFEQSNLASQTARNYGEMGINYAMLPYQQSNLASQAAQNYAQAGNITYLTPFQGANLASQTAQNYAQAGNIRYLTPFQGANLASQTAQNYGQLGINYAMLPYQQANLGSQTAQNYGQALRYFR